jgi:hypothetical protein
MFTSRSYPKRFGGSGLAEDTAALTLTLGEAGTQVEFRSLEQFERWLSSERAFWEWIIAATPEVNLGNVPQLVVGAFGEVAQLITQARDQSEPLTWLQPQAEARWSLAGGYLRYSNGRQGAAILDIRNVAGEEAAAFAYAFLLGRLTLANASNPNHVRGILLTAVPGITDSVDLGRRLANERVNFKAAQASAISRIEKAHEKQDERFDALVQRGRQVARRLLRSRYDNWNAVRDDWKILADNSVAEINSVKKSYEESMRLQGPVKYWSGKAAAHGKNEWWAAQQVAFFFIVAGGFLAASFVVAGNFILEGSRAAAAAGRPEPTAIYIVVTGALAALSTLTFWVGRLLTKLWMSEHHLRNDAHERAVMTTTYLALTRNEKAEQIDRQIILNALFRNTPDGIVKEEGADFGLQALIAKYLSKP